MKPEAPSVSVGPEQKPLEHNPKVEGGNVLKPQESTIEKGAEAYEKRSELGAAAADASSSVATVIPAPVPSEDATNVDDSVTIGDPNPLVANDDDLIEKEWVERAKKIVAETRDNPHQRDEEVGKLQVDYLKKRFGRELGGAE